MRRLARLLCLLAVLPVAACYYPDYVLRPEIVRADANGIVIRTGKGVNPYNGGAALSALRQAVRAERRATVGPIRVDVLLQLPVNAVSPPAPKPSR